MPWNSINRKIGDPPAVLLQSGPTQTLSYLHPPGWWVLQALAIALTHIPTPPKPGWGLIHVTFCYHKGRRLTPSQPRLLRELGWTPTALPDVQRLQKVSWAQLAFIWLRVNKATPDQRGHEPPKFLPGFQSATELKKKENSFPLVSLILLASRTLANVFTVANVSIKKLYFWMKLSQKSRGKKKAVANMSSDVKRIALWGLPFI